MSDGTLEREFQKLSVADKLKYNQFYMFHYQSQWAEEMQEVEVECNVVQVEMVVDESGKGVCWILPVLVKEEPDCQHTTWAPATKTLGMPELPPGADVKELL